MKRSRMGKQFIIRNVPSEVDRDLRRKAERDGKTLNQVAVEALSRAAGPAEGHGAYRDLNDLAGTWVEDPEFDAAVKAQDQVQRRQD
jgi:plasmid stability protein